LPVIASTIITAVPDDADEASGAGLVHFYDDAYSKGPAEAETYARWRALGALGKAEHVISLCARAGLAPKATLEVGCGDGALLSELHRRGFGGRLAGVEISDAAVAIAGARPELDSVESYDGLHLPAADGAYDLGVLSHVLEHVREPAALLSEVARACEAVIVEVPLEANLSARRGAKREQAAAVGHLQRMSRPAVHAIVARAGLRVAFELEDALPLRVHRFFAVGTRGRALAGARWAVRTTLHGLAPALARRLFTVHYACLCLRDG
jgi:SAM-dependent methyltransferase